MLSVATTVAAVGFTAFPSRIVTVGAVVYPEPGVTTVTPLTDPWASIVAVAVGCVPLARFGRENSTIGWIAYPVPPLAMARPSTPPLARAEAGALGLPPPVIATVGVVKPDPASATVKPVTTPGEVTAVAVAPVVGVTYTHMT